ncbi:MAG: 3D-(3,5/4)-trihydroxycyclohexane-1,2-dione acylhydrolase (decyclizing), partial [Chlamydiia bacterium]|nr:3D-(3,5/4)-trihydroxycyclohexane-1,2-dione acylhydrolase (decyclizing) [Chlamydiia bacterium]
MNRSKAVKGGEMQTALLEGCTELKAQRTPPTTVRLTAAQALMRFLAAQQSELLDGSKQPLLGGIWGIYGHGNVAGIGEALYGLQSELPYFRGQNEQGMAHAAIAFAKAHRGRRVMAVTSSIGPGATNMVTAAALAHINRLPVLFLPGDGFLSRRPDPVLQQLESRHSPLLSVNDCFAPVSAYFDRITCPEQLVSSLPEAIRILLSPSERGPVTLSLPQDLQTQAYPFPSSFFAGQVHMIERTRPDRRGVDRTLRFLYRSKRPLIIAGGGIHYSGAEETLQKFCETHSIPLAETQAGKGSLPWNHPLNLGAIGVLGTSAANAVAEEADLILCIGTRLSDFTTASKSLFHRPDLSLIAINSTPFDAAKGNRIGLVCDALEGIFALSEMIREDYADQSFKCTDAYLQEIQRAKAEWECTHQRFTSPTVSALPSDGAVVGAVNRVAGEEAIVVCAAGGLPGELQKLWRTTSPIGYHLEYGYSCMGYEIAGGLGVKMAHPDKEVYVMVGDGSYLMMHTELLTAVQMGLKLNIVLLDNRGFGCIHRLQKACGQPAMGNLFGIDTPTPDFVQNARSYGAHAEQADSIQALKKILQANRNRTECCVTVIRTDPNPSTPGTAWWEVAIAQHS